MKPEIKQRIGQAQSRGVPEEWKIVKVSDLGKVFTGSTPLTADQDNFGNDYQFITPSDFNEQKYIETTARFVSRKGAQKMDLLPPNTIYVVCIGSIGKINMSKYQATCNQQINAFVPYDADEADFLYYSIMYFFNKIKYKYIGTQTLPIVNKKSFSNVKILIPTDREQQKIAQILTTQDKIIELKEKLLSGKQHQKKYLMQQLLTGKKRLPGFGGEWSFPRAKEIFANVSDKQHNGNLRVLSSTQDRGIVPRDEVDIDIKYDTSSLVNYKKVQKGNFVISLRSFQGGIEYSTYTGLVSPAYTVLAPKKDISNEYYKHFFKSTDYINRLNVAVYGIRDGKQISYEDFGRIRIPYPPVDEQNAIATVFATSDREIDLLQQDIEQEKQKKKALMQLLLAGIVRAYNE